MGAGDRYVLSWWSAGRGSNETTLRVGHVAADTRRVPVAVEWIETEWAKGLNDGGEPAMDDRFDRNWSPRFFLDIT